VFGPLELDDGGSVQGQLIDLQGRFNLNSLIDREGRVDPTALALFERLLRVLGLEPLWAPRLADWLDADDQPLANGGEDDLYTTMVPGYRPPNRPVTSISELLLLPGFDRERFATLAPHVAALPRDAAINLCSATPALLDALADERQWVGAEQMLARNRERDCFPRREAFRSGLPTPQQFDQLDRAVGLGERSRYFQLRSVVGVGTTRVSLYSLLRFESVPPEPPRVRVMLRRLAD
jgi:general secretion pathway protein K